MVFVAVESVEVEYGYMVTDSRKLRGANAPKGEVRTNHPLRLDLIRLCQLFI